MSSMIGAIDRKTFSTPPFLRLKEYLWGLLLFIEATRGPFWCRESLFSSLRTRRSVCCVHCAINNDWCPGSTTMDRTKKTAQILRELQIPATTSSSSKGESENDGVDEDCAPKSLMLSETKAEENTAAPGTIASSGDDESGTNEDNGDSSEYTSGVSRSSRKRALADCDDELYYVPPLKTYHKTWAKFEKYLKKYQSVTDQVIVVSQTVKLRNRQINRMKVHTGKSVAQLPLVPEELDPYQRVYISTHGWKSRNRSTGQRPMHMLKSVGCDMRFRAKWAEQSRGNWEIQVKSAFYGHFHPVTEEVYHKYPPGPSSSAQIFEPNERHRARGSKASRVYDYIRALRAVDG
ncbi:hypothetical protein PC128_g16187 [Phytophthora cactorum]|nr:hypothetical protein PC128_g16187 [Phytophthora cactorum]